jgi:ABC-type nitrate/sulfonate/bicarbonate transport system permease component
VAAVLVAWYVFSASGILPPTRFPAPREVW